MVLRVMFTMNIYQRLIVNLLYMLFKLVIGIYYMLPWFISMGIYYLVLSIVKIYLIVCYNFVIKCNVIEILVMVYFY